MIPDDPEALDALAAEHVLGTLDARQETEVRLAMPRNAALRAAVEAWERRLSPLLAATLPEAPPADLWNRIEASLSGRSNTAPPPMPRAQDRALRIWRGWAVGATALAAGLAAVLLYRPADERLMTVLLTDRDQPAWVVETEGEGLRLASLNRRPLEAGRVQQLWALPQGATAPISLGLVPESGETRVAPGRVRPEPGMLIEITLEPPGGSPIGRPTGPILFIGRLTAARSS